MAQKWHEKASVQSSIVNALIGVIPATIVGIATILVQIDLADKQVALVKQASKEQETKDSLAAIRAAKRYHSDSLLAAKNLELNGISILRATNSYHNDSLLATQDLELNRLQFELAQIKRKDDIALSTRLEGINKNQLAISESQYTLQKNRVESEAVKDLMRFGSAVTELGNLLPDNGLNIEDFKGQDSWVKKVVKLLESQLDNPILQEDKTLFEDWRMQLGLLNTRFWIYNINPNFKYVSVDSLKKWIIKNPDELETFKLVENRTNKLFTDSSNFYDNQTYKRMGFPLIKVTADSSGYVK